MASASASAAATMSPRLLLLLLVIVVVHLQIHRSAAVAEDDVRCLRGFKDAISDPDGHLTSWNFANSTVGFVCSFPGVGCWNVRENRVLSLSLPSSSLSGTLPPSLQYCVSLNFLDLSSNSFSGPIPPSLCSWLPYLVNLDLSANSFTGPIPASLSDCKFLNTLYLSGNELSGAIPASISALDRLTKLDVSSNRLSGQIPDALSHFPASSFDGNPSLCGSPVSSGCKKSVNRTGLIIIVAAGVFGAAVSLLVAYLVWKCCFSASAQAKKRAAAAAGGGGGAREDGRWWSERLRTSHHRLVPVSLFQKPLVKVKLADLMTATRDFHPDYIVTAGSGRVGTSYEAVLPDGSALTVKRLHGCSLSEKQFRAEMSQIGQLRHPNLVPLLGFCVVEDERLLIYKHMPTGALSTAVQSGDDALDWPARLRIGTGAARGLAWLHHGFQVPFLHQNVSSNVILLDEDYEPRITDFGLARLVRSAEDGANTTPFLNGDFGEFGYVAPEYATNPVATTKGDVYSFGVILLELATGQKAVEVSSDVAGDGFKGNLVDWVNQLSVSGRLSEAIDKSLRGKGHDGQIVDFLKIACGSVVARPKERPTMFRVYHSLKSIGSTNDVSEQFDEFPLAYGKDEPEAV